MRLIIASVVSLTLALGSTATAETFSLRDLIEGDLSIVSGDKLFSNFEYTYTGDMPTAAGVTISTKEDAFGNYGIRIQGGFVDAYGDGASDALICYQVTVLDPHKRISDAHIAGNPAAIGDALLQVAETFLPEVENATMSIHNISDVNVQLSDAVYFDDSYVTLHVQKDILAYAQTPGSVATLSFVDQTFSQIMVPEPSSIAMLVAGVALLGCVIRRRR